MSAAKGKKNLQGVEEPNNPAGEPGILGSANLPKHDFPRHPADEKPRVFSRVPTHSFGMALERRFHPRACLRLPLRLTRVNHHVEAVPITLLTRNISSSGVYFLAPKRLEPGSSIELEVGLVERPLGRGGVRMKTLAHVVRAEETPEPGWHGVAARFDDIAFQRDEELPPRFLR